MNRMRSLEELSPRKREKEKEEGSRIEEVHDKFL
jgi:hypothetical protein